MLASTHPQYGYFKERWERNRDACSGELAVKKKGRLYLPDDSELIINGVKQGRSIDSIYELRYQNYLMRASFMTIAQHTRNGLVGMVFNKDPIVELGHPELDYLRENVDGAGQSLIQLSKRVMTDVIEVGRDGFLVDLPATGEVLSKAQEDAAFIAPRIHEYTAENIIDWDEEKIGSLTVLTYVLLRESYYEKTDNSGLNVYGSLKYRYIALRLTDGVYTQQQYDESRSPTTDPIIVRKRGGKSLNYIPFYFVGAENNKPDVDESPLSGIVDLNYTHYRNSADEESLNHTYALPTPHVDVGTNETAESFQTNNPRGLQAGNGVVTQGGGTFDIKQIQADNAISEKMKELEARAEKIGARFAGEGNSQNVTAEAARINAAFTTSTLTTAVGNVSEALEAALEACADILGLSTEPVQFELNKEFYGANKDWQAANIVMQIRDFGGYTDDGFINEMKAIGFNLDGDLVAGI